MSDERDPENNFEEQDPDELAVDRTEFAEERTEFAEERTEWADKRTYLAQQRTYAAWIRTGISSMAIGLGVIEFVETVDPTWITTATGLIFIGIGGLIVTLAFFSDRKVSMAIKKSSRPEMGMSTKWTGLISAALLLCSLAGIILVLI